VSFRIQPGTLPPAEDGRDSGARSGDAARSRSQSRPLRPEPAAILASLQCVTSPQGLGTAGWFLRARTGVRKSALRGRHREGVGPACAGIWITARYRMTRRGQWACRCPTFRPAGCPDAQLERSGSPTAPVAPEGASKVDARVPVLEHPARVVVPDPGGFVERRQPVPVPRLDEVELVPEQRRGLAALPVGDEHDVLHAQ
jgi:hypothetical protein